MGTVKATIDQADCIDWLPGKQEQGHLVYADPPFFTQRDHEDQHGVTQFTDRWDSLEHYLGWLMDRIQLMWEATHPEGSLMVHCDPTASHYIKVRMDQLCGRHRFANEIIWSYTGGHATKRRFPRKHDTILFYQKDPDRSYFKTLYRPMKGHTIKTYNQVDEKGRYYKRFVKGKEYRSYLDDHPGVPHASVWTDIYARTTVPNAREWTGYPTQKPIRLLARLIEATTRTGDTVIDPFCGSGTTLEAAIGQGRNAMGCDINPQAIKIASRRADTTNILELDWANPQVSAPQPL